MRTIPLTQGQAAIVDDSVFERLSLWKWTAARKATGFYAFRSIELPSSGGKRRRLRIYLHRYLMGFPSGDLFDVHHKNHQPLDNRCENLEVLPVTIHVRLKRKRGGLSSSHYIGVSRWAGCDKWAAQLFVKRKRVFFGSYDTELEAAVAFDHVSITTNGAFAMRNYDVR